MSEFTNEQREQLKEKLDAIDKAREPLRVLLKPLQEAMAAIDALHDAAVEEAGVELLDEICEGCECLLIAGDLGHRCDDGPVTCEACSPTWNDVAQQYREAGHEQSSDGEEIGLTLADIEARIAAGDGGKKHVWPL